MTKRVIVMNFEVESQAYQAFSEIKKIAMAGKIKGEQMAVVTHSGDGEHQFKIDDFLDFTGANKSSKGGLIGMLIGIIGGPLGVLLGWFGGSMIGATQDAKEIQEAQNVFQFLVNQIGEGQTGLILIADEEDNRPINEIVIQKLHGGITRLDLAEVEAEVKKAQDVENKTKEAAKNNWRENHSDQPTASDESKTAKPAVGPHNDDSNSN